MTQPSVIYEILQKFPGLNIREAVPLGNSGGFSGAALWRIVTPSGPLCLRKWPPQHPTVDGLRWLHDLLIHAVEQGVCQIPAPLPDRGGDTIALRNGSCYELTPWMPGTADFHLRPSPTRLNAAMTVLARTHRAFRTCPGHHTKAEAGCSPGILQRATRLRSLLAGELTRIGAAIEEFPDFEIRSRGRQMLAMFPRVADNVRALLQQASGIEVSLQPCIRDIWHDHVLFTGDEVTGIVDFGAVRQDHPACDLARLIGSLVGDDRPSWLNALESYEAAWERPLDSNELLLIRAFDQSSVLMSGLSWLEWICVERRRFEEPQRILARLDEQLLRLESLCGASGRGSP